MLRAVPSSGFVCNVGAGPLVCARRGLLRRKPMASLASVRSSRLRVFRSRSMCYAGAGDSNTTKQPPSPMLDMHALIATLSAA